MITYNLCLKPHKEQRRIQLMRQASLLIHHAKIGKITRSQINSEILKLDVNDQEKFKVFLNEFMAIKDIRVNNWRKKRKTNNGSDQAKLMIKKYREMLNNDGN